MGSEVKLEGKVVKSEKGKIVVYVPGIGEVPVYTKTPVPVGVNVKLTVRKEEGRFVAEKVGYDEKEAVIELLKTFRGIGEKKAKELYEKYGKSALSLFEERFRKYETALRQVFGEKRTKKALEFLKKTGFKLEENPYVLLQLKGFGFKTVDALARKFLKEDSPLRIQEWVRYYLTEETRRGHLFVEFPELEEKAKKFFGKEVKLVFPEGVETDGERVFLTRSYQAEAEIFHFFTENEGEEELERSKKSSFLTEEQELAVETALKNKTCIICGYAGTGKTTTVKEIVEELRSKGLEVLLLAPTGKAVKRLEEVVGIPASTIHRAIIHNELPFADAVILDEASMVDSFLFAYLVRRVRGKFILVGDPAQLPPVGPGSPFRDLVKSGAVPTVFLKTVHRSNSGIVEAGKLVREGKFPKVKAKDFEWKPLASEELAVKLLEKAKQNNVELQLLSGVYKGKLGIDNLNKIAQDIFNPSGKEWKGFRVGDRVIHSGDNNYDELVMRGDYGKVIEVKEGTVVVEFWDGRVKKYTSDDINDLSLSYALSVHKAQGSEYDYVAVIFDGNSFPVLNRYWLYTAITRAKKKCFLFAEGKYVAIAVKNYSYPERRTFLGEFFRDSLKRKPTFRLG